MAQLDRWQISGVFAAGVLTAVIALSALPSRSPISPAEARYLAFESRDSVAFPGRRYFGPYPCEDDCSGHVAGWYWARDQRLKSPVACEGSRSTSFYEGCLVYLGVIGEIRDPGN